jgi:hypothetical protein
VIYASGPVWSTNGSGNINKSVFSLVNGNSIEEDLMESGHFMEEEEFSLLIMYLLKRIQELVKVEKKSLKQLFELQDLCYSTMALLDGGLRREVMSSP